MKKLYQFLALACAITTLTACGSSSLQNYGGNGSFAVWDGRVYYQNSHSFILSADKDGNGYKELDTVGGSIYISDGVLYTLGTNEYGNPVVVRCNPNGTGRKVIAEDADDIEGVANGYVYYSIRDLSASDGSRWLCCVKTDGEDAHQIGKWKVADFASGDGCIYYTGMSYDGNGLDQYTGLVRANPDGSDAVRIAEGSIRYFWNTGSYIIYEQLDSSDYGEISSNDIYCLELQTGKSQPFWDSTNLGIDFITFYDIAGDKDRYVYLAGYYPFTLCRFQPLSSKPLEAVFTCPGVNDKIRVVDLTNEWVVYGDSEHSFISKFDGTHKQQLCDAEVEAPCFVGDQLFFIALDTLTYNRTFYRFDTASRKLTELPDKKAKRLRISADQITSFYFSSASFGVPDEFSVSKDDLTATMVLRNYDEGESTANLQWDEETWDSFTQGLVSCRIAAWEEEYHQPVTDDFYWHVEVTGDFGVITSEGNSGVPEEWPFFQSLMEKYFYNDIP